MKPSYDELVGYLLKTMEGDEGCDCSNCQLGRVLLPRLKEGETDGEPGTQTGPSAETKH